MFDQFSYRKKFIAIVVSVGACGAATSAFADEAISPAGGQATHSVTAVAPFVSGRNKTSGLDGDSKSQLVVVASGAFPSPMDDAQAVAVEQVRQRVVDQHHPPPPERRDVHRPRLPEPRDQGRRQKPQDHLDHRLNHPFLPALPSSLATRSAYAR